MLKHLLNHLFPRPGRPPLSRSPLPGTQSLGSGLSAMAEGAAERQRALLWESLESQWLDLEALPAGDVIKSPAVDYNPHLVKREILGKLETRFNSDAHK